MHSSARARPAHAPEVLHLRPADRAGVHLSLEGRGVSASVQGVKLASRFATNLGIGLILAAILVPLVGRYAYGGLLAVAGIVCIIVSHRMLGRLR